MIKPDHWAMHKIPHQFRSKIQLDWELSTGGIIRKDKQYTILAQVDKNPAIISINDF